MPAAPTRRLFHGTLADLPSLEARSDLTGPVMTIIGDAVAGANFSNVRAARGTQFHAGQAVHAGEGGRAMKVLTANRLTDGEAVWFSADQRWSETIADAEIANDKAGEASLEAIGKAAYDNNEVVDVNLIDVTAGRRRDPPAAAARADPRRRPDQPQRPRQAGADRRRTPA